MTPFGMFHTVLSLVALGAGLVALVRDKKISLENRVGKLYVSMTVLTAATGLGIFHHGGFGKPHALAILTLAVIALAVAAKRTSIFGRASREVETVAYSATFLFHLIPGVTETTTRLPVGAPLVASPEAPELQAVTGALFLLFLVGAALQVRALRGERASMGAARRLYARIG
ncbi:MAG: hypothetical protein KF819_16115 [Labilithrix sp.]|nr:hypothetical protein [Labilithrix sp.]